VFPQVRRAGRLKVAETVPAAPDLDPWATWAIASHIIYQTRCMTILRLNVE